MFTAGFRMQMFSGFGLVCYASQPPPPLRFIMTMTQRQTRALSITCIAACLARLLMTRLLMQWARLLMARLLTKLGTPFEGAPFTTVRHDPINCLLHRSDTAIQFPLHRYDTTIQCPLQRYDTPIQCPLQRYDTTIQCLHQRSDTTIQCLLSFFYVFSCICSSLQTQVG